MIGIRKHKFKQEMIKTTNLQHTFIILLKYHYKNYKIENNIFHLNEKYNINIFFLPYGKDIYMKLESKTENTNWFGNHSIKKCYSFMDLKNEIDDLIEMIQFGDYVIL